MAEATTNRDPLVGPEGFDADVAAKARAISVATTTSSAMFLSAACLFEGTVGPAEASYGLPRFDAGSALMVLPGQRESLGEDLGGALYIGPEEVPGYRALEGDPITRVVTVPKDVAIWGQDARPLVTVQEYLRPVGRSTRTNISALRLPSSSRPRPRRSGREALEHLSQSTALSHAELGTLIGASRRSVYNWLRGRVMSPKFETRALRLREVLRPLAERRGPGELASWLEAGTTTPAELLREERWDDVDALVQQELKPRVLEPMSAEPEQGEPEVYSAETRRAVLASLRTPPPIEQRLRPDWKPREVTGAVPLAHEDVG
jgi:hypothetical protein